MKQRLIAGLSTQNRRICILEEDETAVGRGEEQQDNHHYGSGPRRHCLKEPHKDGEEEDCQSSLLNDCHSGDPILYRKAPYYQCRHDSDDKADCS